MWIFGFTVIGGLIALVGAIGQLVAWIGALVNTARLDDKLWFVVLLILGVISLAFIATLIYILVAPDEERIPASPSHGAPHPA